MIVLIGLAMHLKRSISLRMEQKSPIYYHRVDVNLLQHILSVYVRSRWFFNKIAISPPAVSDTQEVTTANSCLTLARGKHEVIVWR